MTFLSSLRQPPRLTLSEWANECLMLSAEDASEPGKYSTTRAPYQRGILDSISNPLNSEVVIMSSAQVGKTLIAKATIGYFIDQDPAPLLVVQPTIEMSETFSKDRLAAQLEAAGYAENEHVGEKPEWFNTRPRMAHYIVGQALNCLRIGMGPHPITGSFVDKYFALPKGDSSSPNVNVDLPDTAAQDSASKSNNPAVSG